jgi:hypothetical protein
MCQELNTGDRAQKRPQVTSDLTEPTFKREVGEKVKISQQIPLHAN